MTTVDYSQPHPRIVHELPDRLPEHRTPPVRVLFLDDFLALASNLRAAGYEPGDQVQRIEAVSDAVEKVLVHNPLADVDLMTADPAVIADAVRQAGIAQAASMEIVRQRDGLQHQLARSAADHMAAGSDAVVKAMRKRWDPAVKTVKIAAERGLTQRTNTTALLDTGTPEAIEAYRNLGPAVAELDTIAGLRNQLTRVCRVGPADYPTTAFVTDVARLADLDGAERIWTGEAEVVQHDLVPGVTGYGSHLARIRKQRLGGPWLSLVVAGYTLRLNTGPEAQAVVEAARRGGNPS